MTRRLFSFVSLRFATGTLALIVLGGWYAVDRYLPEVLERHRVSGCIEQAARFAELLGAQRAPDDQLVLRTRAAVVQATGFTVHQIAGYDCNPAEVAIGVDAADIAAGPRGRPDEIGETVRATLAAVYRDSGANRAALVRVLRARAALGQES